MAFNLGEGKPGRLVAKIFKFRLIYGGSAYSYAHDPDFMGVSTSMDFWQGVIDAYYTKYNGIRRWHDGLLETVKKQGYLEIPSGRCYSFEAVKKYGDWQWPLTTIKNYPVQGFGADLVMLARIEFFKRLKASGLEALFIQTIHDSIVVDCPTKNLEAIGKMLRESIEIVPQRCQEVFGYQFSLPLNCEIQYGLNKLDMKELLC